MVTSARCMLAESTKPGRIRHTISAKKFSLSANQKNHIAECIIYLQVQVQIIIHRKDAIKSLFILAFIINIRVCDVNIIIGVEFK